MFVLLVLCEFFFFFISMLFLFCGRLSKFVLVRCLLMRLGILVVMGKFRVKWEILDRNFFFSFFKGSGVFDLFLSWEKK